DYYCSSYAGTYTFIF
nr:immunoglobulin light chain junction region [Macaca mulatta]